MRPLRTGYLHLVTSLCCFWRRDATAVRQRCRFVRILLILGLIQLILVPVYVIRHGGRGVVGIAKDVGCAPGLGMNFSTAYNGTGDDERCVWKFMSDYDHFCRNTFFGPSVGSSSAVNQSSCLCPCLPSTLVGTMKASHIADIKDAMTDQLPGVVGGRWRPSNCVARQRVAIIIPYRDRAEHLRTFLSSFHPLLQRQQLDYTIFVVEQVKPLVFNKAMLMNSGFVEVRKRAHFDCFIFHDVDMIPLDDRNMFTCSKTPRHVGAYVDKWGFRTFYDKMFGGAVAFRQADFELVNGFSNSYWGWGGEDDDMFQRTRHANLTLAARFPLCVAKYKMIQHVRDSSNPSLGKAHRGWSYLPNEYSKDGLNSLNYTVIGVEERPLFTRFQFELSAPPADVQKVISEKLGTTTHTAVNLTTDDNHRTARNRTSRSSS